MRSGRTYEVFMDGKPAGLVGSTLCTLEQRRKNHYPKRFGPSVELRLIREVSRHESEDDVDYNFHLKAAEALDIARKKTYVEDGGLNKMSPLIQAMGRPMLDSEMARLGGLAGGRKGGLIGGPKGGRTNALSGHCARIAGLGGRRSNLPRTQAQMEAARKSGEAAGRKHAESHTGVCGRTPEKMREDGIKAGRIGGRKVKELGLGIFNLTHEQRQELGRKGSREGKIRSGQMAKERGTGIFAPGFDRRKGSVKQKELGIGIFSPGMAAKASCQHWNINRGKPCACGAHL